MARLPITTITKTSTSEVTLNYLTAVNGTPAADQFRSTITGRSKMIDFSTDMLPRMGVERIPVQSIMRVDGEVGPAGEVVYKPVNDKYDQIRFVGGWSNQNDSSAPRAQSTVIGDFCEITFYGTGLNILCYSDATNRAMTISVDGGATVSIANQGSGILTSRNYAPNSIINLVSGLTLGLHTVKVSSVVTTLFIAYGFEILNESSSIKVGAGQVVANGVARTIAAHTSAYNSGFESGTLGTRGGRVVVYAKRDGTIGKAVTPTDAASLTLTSANHANEEVIRNYYWREFGAGRTDDFSGAVPATAAFTLDDGTTTLAGTNLAAFAEGIYSSATNSFITITFVGTGLDFVTPLGVSAVNSTYAFLVDGVYIATGKTGHVAGLIYKIVSGLPYGTHTVKFLNTAASSSHLVLKDFIIYGPKKPTLPTGAMELADYNVMADYVVATTSSKSVVSQGVLRKVGARENVFSGTWIMDASPDPANFDNGWDIRTLTAASYSETTFFGTGIEYRTLLINTMAYNYTLTVDGLALNAGTNIGSTISLVATGVTGMSLSAAGVVTGTAAGQFLAFVRISGLSLGKHTLRVTQNTTANLYADSFDIITPIHTHKNNGPFIVQNTLSVGSQGINDGRKFGSQWVLPSTSATTKDIVAVTTIVTSYSPFQDMQTTIYAKEDSILTVNCEASLSSAAGAWTELAVFVDGVMVKEGQLQQYSTLNYGLIYPLSSRTTVSAGWHHVKIMIKTNGSITNIGVGANDGRHFSLSLSKSN